MTGNGTKGRIMPALSGGMKKLKWIDDEARSPKGQRSLARSLKRPPAFALQRQLHNVFNSQ
jgi:hypothetical protein